MRVGVVGCGYWGAKHVRVLHGLSDADAVAVIDRREERRTSLLRTFPGSSSYQRLDDAIDAVDAVVIATPPTTHFPLALAAIQAGKHVLIEKPLATSAAAAQRLIDEAASRSLTLMVGHTFEYNAAVRKLRQVVQSGDLGKLYYIDTARLNLGLYQADVDVIWDLAPHDVSIVNYLLGARPTSVEAWASSHAHEQLSDLAYLRLHYAPTGITANIHVSWLYPQKVRRVTVVGSSKMAVYNDVVMEERVRIYDKGVMLPANGKSATEMPMTYRYGDITSPFIELEEPLAVQDRHFLECIRDSSRPLTDGENGLAVVQVLECAGIALRARRPVQIEDLEERALDELHA